MDLVELTYFEVDFSNTSQYNVNMKENGASDAKNANNGFVVPVVFDVSTQWYSKLIQLYFTVKILNATSIPLELRFDIPFGISPKEFLLPLHLAEAGRMRWHPLGNSYLWSEAHNLSDLLSFESKIGFLRSYVCYPSHPSSDPYRCCFSLQRISIPTADRLKKGSNQTDGQGLLDSRTSSNILQNQLGSSTQLWGNNVEKSEDSLRHACILLILFLLEVKLLFAFRKYAQLSMVRALSSFSTKWFMRTLVPQPSSNAMFILSVTSSAFAGPFAGRTGAITFQPR
ncbi:hypothetical protein PTKIN_Ptkin14bG0011200 [Pterospermum kingtungense]